MADLSRRQLLFGGGAVGVLGALTALVGPAGATTWSPGGAGSMAPGDGADPNYVWDDEVDQLIASVIDRGDTAAVNAALQNWTYNSQPLPDGLPADVAAFIERARVLPPWADSTKLANAVDFVQRRGTYLGVLYAMGSGMMSTVIPHEARAVYWSKGGADIKDRIAKTATLGYDIGTPDAYQPTGHMIVTSVKTRMTHAAVRHLLPRSPSWTATADESKPISQADILITWNSLATFTMHKLGDWGVPVNKTDSDAYLHLWQLAAHMLGVRDEYIAADWDAANSQFRQLLQPVLGPTPEGIELAQDLYNLSAEVDPAHFSKPLFMAFTRYTCGDQIADWLTFPRDLYWDTFVRTGWPVFVAMKEGFQTLPLAPTVSWIFDELLRRGTLFYLNDGQPIYITIPDTNRPGN